jgi:hypothetical protein
MVFLEKGDWKGSKSLKVVVAHFCPCIIFAPHEQKESEYCYEGFVYPANRVLVPYLRQLIN